jgi:signal transduction histidine kinase
MILAIGTADYVTGPEVGLSLLYLLVIAWAAWTAGRPAGVAVGFVAAAVWTQIGLLTSPADFVATAWNGFSRAVIFAGVAALIGTLRSEEQRLRSVDRQREEFLSLVAHELRQPVAAIAVAAAGLASAPGLSAKERRVLLGLRGQSRRLIGLAEDLLAIARFEGGRMELDRGDVDLGAVVGAVARDCSEPERVHVGPPPGELHVHGDPVRLAQAVENLISNALKYSPPDAPVEVSLVRLGRTVSVQVRDRGIGLAAADVQRLFRKYGRVENARTADVQGVGLGLFLVRLIAEAHGGRARAESAGPGLGATFSVELPLRAAA